MVAKVIVGLIAGALGWVWVGALSQAVGHDRALRGWPRTEGRLTKWDGRAVRYAYEAGGKAYQGSRLRLGERVALGPVTVSNAPMTGGEVGASVAAALGEGGQVGGPVTVRYDPADPASSFIDPYRPRAPLMLMTITGVLSAGLASVVAGIRAGEGDVPTDAGDGWVRLPPLTSMRAMALALSTGACVGLVLAAGPGAYCVLFGKDEAFVAPLVAMILLGLAIWGAVYHLWRWRRVAYADVAVKGGEMLGVQVWVARGVPFAVRLAMRAKSGRVEGGEVELRREEKVTRGSGKDRRTSWETRETWTAPLLDGPTDGVLNEVGGDRVNAVVRFTVPGELPGTSGSFQYRLRPRVRISGGPDYSEEFDVGVR